MDKFNPPQSLNFNQENLSQAWKRWKSEFTFYMTATESDGKENKVKSSILLTCIGDKGREVYSTFNLAEADKLKLDKILEKFDEYCEPVKNITFIRHKFFSCKQEEGQRFDEYLTELKKKAQDCEFGGLKDELIKDILICGLSDDRLRGRLLRMPKVTLKEATEQCMANEEVKRHSVELNVQTSVNAVSRGVATGYSNSKVSRGGYNNSNSNFNRGGANGYNNSGGGTSGYNRSSNNDNADKSKNIITQCKFCSGSHPRGECPAFHRTCGKCNRKGHYASCCYSKNKVVKNINLQDTNQRLEHDGDGGGFFLGMINHNDPLGELEQVANDTSEVAQTEDTKEVSVHEAEVKLEETTETQQEVTLEEASETQQEIEVYEASVAPETKVIGTVSVQKNEQTENTADAVEQGEGNEKSIGSLSAMKSSKWEAIIQTNNTLVTYKLDTGAEINVLPKTVYMEMQDKPKLLPTAVTLTAYNDTSIPVIGKCIARIKIENKVTPVLFIVADVESSAILGQNTCDKLQLIKRL